MIEGGPVDVRLAVEAERAQALDVTLAAYGEYRELLPARYWESYRAHIVDTHGRLARPEESMLQLVAERDGSLVGTGLYCPPGSSFSEATRTARTSADCPEVRLLAVAPEGRGAGVGRALMNACIERAREEGAPGLVLHTMEIMRAARALYDSLGFVRAPELDFRPARDWYVEGFRLAFR